MFKLVKLSLVSFALMTSSLMASDVLVTVNGKNITKKDAQAFVKAQAPKANFEIIVVDLSTCRTIVYLCFSGVSDAHKCCLFYQHRRSVIAPPINRYTHMCWHTHTPRTSHA